MNFAGAIVRTELDSAHNSDPESVCRSLSFLEPGERIVISESNRSESRDARGIDYSGGWKRSIRRRRVHVEIDFAGRHVGVPRGRHFL